MATKIKGKRGKKKGDKNINEVNDLKGKLFQQEVIDVCLNCKLKECKGICPSFPKL